MSVRRITHPTQKQLGEAWNWMKAYALSGQKGWMHAARILARLGKVERKLKRYSRVAAERNIKEG